MSTTVVERRRTTRLRVRLEAEALTQSGERFRAWTSDLSFRGLLLETTWRAEPGESLRLRLWSEPDSPAMVLAVRVVAARPIGLACEITAIHHPEALERLRRFLVAHSQDDHALVAELRRAVEGTEDDEEA
jgi:PilZ domain